jgi:hypothetical protein
MRLMKSLALTACFALSAIATARAQGPRPFRDAWFWGGFGGMTSYTPANPIDARTAGTSTLAPQVGADWLITRKAGGLYVSFAQAFMTTQGAVENGPTSADTGFRYVDVQNLRRINIAALAFPGNSLRWHPYLGFGLAFDYIAGVSPIFTSADTPKQEEFALSLVNETKAALGPLFMTGVQYRALSTVSVFGQFTVSGMAKDFLLSNGNPIAMGFQAGLRYNIGTSIDKGY